MRFRGLAQTLFFNVCDLPKARFAEIREEVPQPAPSSLREIADSRLRSLRQPRREKFTEPDFALLARAFDRARALHPFHLTAWAFLPDHWHCICAPVYPVMISLAMK